MCMRQGAGPRLTLREWAEYWATPSGKRRKLLNVVSLSLAGTPLEVCRDVAGGPSVTLRMDHAEPAWLTHTNMLLKYVKREQPFPELGRQCWWRGVRMLTNPLAICRSLWVRREWCATSTWWLQPGRQKPRCMLKS